MFEPAGERAQWRIVYDRLVRMQIGDILHDDELFDLLPDAPEASVRGAFYRAMQQMEQDQRRTFARVRMVGFRMVEAFEHEGLARTQHRKAKRRLASAHSKARSADRTLLTPEERRRIDAVEDHLARQRDMIRRLDARVSKAEDRMAAAEKDQLVLADRVERVEKLLSRHGINDSE